MANSNKWLAGKRYKFGGDSPRKVCARITEEGGLWVYETTAPTLAHREPREGMVYTTTQGFVLPEDVVPYKRCACAHTSDCAF